MLLVRRIGVIAASLGLTAGCAGGGDSKGGSYGVFEEGEGAGESQPSSGGTVDPTAEDAAEADGPSMPPDLGACEDDGDCVLPDAGCYANGSCNGGVCEFPPKFAGDPCDDADPCTGPDVCDGAGTCLGDPLPCTAPHAQGGVCMAGLCMGLECEMGWGNCNGDWVDGCELAVDTPEHCGGCDMPCVAGAHASASCNAGACERQCDAPWANCDGDWANGCEIPEGVPNQCDAGGLNADSGCWTAWCGASNDPNAVNFGDWYCFECSTCHVPAGGQCQWCDHGSGNWYPAEGCACGAYEDLSCGA